MHRFPFVCVSIALVASRQPLVAVVFNPILGELFIAQRCEGAFCFCSCTYPLCPGSQHCIDCTGSRTGLQVQACLERTCLHVSMMAYVNCRGKGATLNGQRIQVSETTDLSGALTATELGTARDKATFAAVTDRMSTVAEATHSIRQVPSFLSRGGTAQCLQPFHDFFNPHYEGM